MVNNFEMKYIGKENAKHLVGIIKKHYEMTMDWECTKYCRLTLEWDYIKREVHLSMPGYIDNALQRFNHMRPNRIQNQPYKHAAPNYGEKSNMQNPKRNPTLIKEDRIFTMQVLGVFLFLGRAIDSTLLMPLSAIASEQANPTEETMKKCKQF